MEIETFNYKFDPEKVIKENFDCIWITFSARKKPSPLKSKALQWVDWKLQGQISRFIQETFSNGNKKGVTYLHALSKLSIPYVVLNPSDSQNWGEFQKNCEGLKLKKVLIYCEEDSKLFTVQESLNKREWGSFPEKIILGSESEESA